MCHRLPSLSSNIIHSASVSMHIHTLLLSSLLTFVFAVPSKHQHEVKRAATCTFTNASAARASAKSCQTIVLSNIAVPAGQTLDLTEAADNTHVCISTMTNLFLIKLQIIFSGTTTFGFKAWTGPLIQVSGTGQTITGTSDHLIDAGGEQWWDGKGGNGGINKPKFFKANLKSSSITRLNIKNTPVQGFSISGCKDLTLDHITIDSSDGDTKGGHNTDAFDVGTSTGVIISNAIVHNQDDCMAVNSGSNITFTGGSCTGGHGISIGSVGGRSDNNVSNVTISNSKIIDSTNGVRVKTVSGATGSVKGVTYSGIILDNISTYGVVIEQDYENGSPTGTPTAGVPITGLTLNGVTGTIASGGTNVYILCAKGACSNWTWKNVNIGGGKKSRQCQNVPSPASC